MKCNSIRLEVPRENQDIIAIRYPKLWDRPAEKTYTTNSAERWVHDSSTPLEAVEEDFFRGSSECAKWVWDMGAHLISLKQDPSELELCLLQLCLLPWGPLEM